MDEPATPAPTFDDPWTALKRLTPARIALGRVGDGVPTRAVLDFGLAHARARDAVHASLCEPALLAALRAAGFEALSVHSAVADRNQYLLRPDLGRRLDEASAALLDARAASTPPPRPSVVFVVADGLSALAVQAHALPLLDAVTPLLGHWHIGPVVVARQARVALGDEIAARLQAECVAVLIGERPGLSSPDSLGVYLTLGPRVGCSDAQRNCISNIRPQGLSYAAAARTLHALMVGARRLGCTGVRLKDSGLDLAIPAEAGGVAGDADTDADTRIDANADADTRTDANPDTDTPAGTDANANANTDPVSDTGQESGPEPL